MNEFFFFFFFKKKNVISLIYISIDSSRYGWCGTTSEYCGYKCQSDYGRCDNISLNTSNLGKNMVEISTSQSGIEGLCKNSKLSKSIIVYYPEWKYYDFPPKNIPFNKLTHINYG